MQRFLDGMDAGSYIAPKAIIRQGVEFCNGNVKKKKTNDILWWNENYGSALSKVS